MTVTGDLDIQRWTFADREQLGVLAVDPVGHKIGMNNAKDTYYPLDRFKQALVGTIDRYKFHNPSGAEADWNIYIRPSPAFAFILNDALPSADPGEVHECELAGHKGSLCLEAEVTPDETFYDNPFFPAKDDASPLVGHDIGVYGPWVQDDNHGLRPEIHPSEALWWRDVREEGAASVSTYHILVVQDDSNRFDRPGDFSGQIVRPWAKPPITTEFRIAARIPWGGGRRFVVEELFGRNVVSVAPSSGPFERQLRIGNRLVGITNVAVRKSLADPTHVDVAFDSFTADRTPLLFARELRGFIVLRVSAGLGDRGDEGYIVLRVTEEVAQGWPGVLGDLGDLLARRARRATGGGSART